MSDRTPSRWNARISACESVDSTKRRVPPHTSARYDTVTWPVCKLKRWALDLKGRLQIDRHLLARRIEASRHVGKQQTALGERVGLRHPDRSLRSGEVRIVRDTILYNSVQRGRTKQLPPLGRNLCGAHDRMSRHTISGGIGQILGSFRRRLRFEVRSNRTARQRSSQKRHDETSHTGKRQPPSCFR